MDEIEKMNKMDEIEKNEQNGRNWKMDKIEKMDEIEKMDKNSNFLIFLSLYKLFSKVEFLDKNWGFGTVCVYHLLRSAYFLCEFFSSFLTLDDLECNFWKITLKSCSWKSVSKMPSKITIPNRLFNTGCCSISKSIVNPYLEVSDPMTRRNSLGKLEKRAALATMRVRIFVFSSRGCLEAAG